MDNMMQGYDVDAAVSQIGKAVSRAAHVSPQEAQAFVRRAIEADLRYMHETGVLDDDGLMGEEEYDDDDAFETLFARLTDGVEDDAEIGRIAQMLDSYMEAPARFHGRRRTAGRLTPHRRKRRWKKYVFSKSMRRAR